ncbi:MAG: hypothetical protein ACRYGA_10615 [Janthinobacterium lividum]
MAAALFSSCSDRLTNLRKEGARESGFLGNDGDAQVFCNREREEVCIQTGSDVCTVKADGRVFLNGDPLRRDQREFAQMRRRLADLGDRVIAGRLEHAVGTGGATACAPWDPASSVHVNYVL